MNENNWLDDRGFVRGQGVAPAPERSPTAIPEHVREVIGKPSVLPTENAAECDVLLLRLAEAARPGDMIEWTWISDVASIVWEMRRLRNLRDRLVESDTPEGLGDLARELIRKEGVRSPERTRLRNRIIDHWNSNDPDRREIVFRFLRRRGVEFDHVYAMVYQKWLDKFAKIDGLIADLGRRRDATLREIERRREAIARRLRNVTDKEFDAKEIRSWSTDQ